MAHTFSNDTALHRKPVAMQLMHMLWQFLVRCGNQSYPINLCTYLCHYCDWLQSAAK